MTDPSTALRDHLARALEWGEAHVDFDKAVDGIPAALRTERPVGFDHSIWDLLEHLRIAQKDILDFAVNAKYEHTMKWPDDYWPSAAPSDADWRASIAAFKADRAALRTLVKDAAVDLSALVPTGKDQQTYLRAILLVIDHNAYHLGQLIAVRRALGAWKG